jgi:hypothetical protein
MRVRRGVAQTPVVRFENRKTGRTVTLIATMHAGTNAYFKKLNDVIAGLEAEGALICYEGIRPAADKEWAAAADGELAVRGLSRTVSSRGLPALCRYLGWVEQGTGLKYSPSWRNVDMTDLELVRQAQPRNISEHSDGFSNLFAGLTPEQFDVVMGSGSALVIRVQSLDRFRLVERWSLRTVSSDAYRHVHRVMVDDRNRGALAKLPLDADAVLLWGDGHLPGLAAGLKKAGYRHRSTTWVSVGELPAVWPCLRAFWMWLRVSGEDDQGDVPRQPPRLPEPGDQRLECLRDTGDVLGRLAENFEHSRGLGSGVVEGLGDLGGARRDLGELPAPAVAHRVLPLHQSVLLECSDRGGDLVRDAVLLHPDGERGAGAELVGPGHWRVTDGP